MAEEDSLELFMRSLCGGEDCSTHSVPGPLASLSGSAEPASRHDASFKDRNRLLRGARSLARADDAFFSDAAMFSRAPALYEELMGGPPQGATVRNEAFGSEEILGDIPMIKQTGGNLWGELEENARLSRTRMAADGGGDVRGAILQKPASISSFASSSVGKVVGEMRKSGSAARLNFRGAHGVNAQGRGCAISGIFDDEEGPMSAVSNQVPTLAETAASSLHARTSSSAGAPTPAAFTPQLFAASVAKPAVLDGVDAAAGSTTRGRATALATSAAGVRTRDGAEPASSSSASGTTSVRSEASAAAATSALSASDRRAALVEAMIGRVVRGEDKLPRRRRHGRSTKSNADPSAGRAPATAAASEPSGSASCASVLKSIAGGVGHSAVAAKAAAAASLPFSGSSSKSSSVFSPQAALLFSSGSRRDVDGADGSNGDDSDDSSRSFDSEDTDSEGERDALDAYFCEDGDHHDDDDGRVDGDGDGDGEGDAARDKAHDADDVRGQELAHMLRERASLRMAADEEPEAHEVDGGYTRDPSSRAAAAVFASTSSSASQGSPAIISERRDVGAHQAGPSAAGAAASVAAAATARCEPTGAASLDVDDLL